VQYWLSKLGFIKPEMPDTIPFIATYSLLILDYIVKNSNSLSEVKQEVEQYPEDTHREGFVCKSMMNFVTVFDSLEHLKLGIEQRFDDEGGRKGAESRRDSMGKLESWHEE